HPIAPTYCWAGFRITPSTEVSGRLHSYSRPDGKGSATCCSKPWPAARPSSALPAPVVRKKYSSKEGGAAWSRSATPTLLPAPSPRRLPTRRRPRWKNGHKHSVSTKPSMPTWAYWPLNVCVQLDNHHARILMCGLTGFYSPRSTGERDSIGLDMANAISHRGPDDAGVWSDHASGLTLAHRRLSILDLSPAGHQPMH